MRARDTGVFRVSVKNTERPSGKKKKIVIHIIIEF